MNDLSKTITPKSDQLNADDLIGGPITIKVTGVRAQASSEMQPVSINFEGDDGKPFRPCKSMRRVLVQVWGKDGNQYAGRSMTLYLDPKVKFGGIEVGGIRISHMSGMTDKIQIALTASKAKRVPFVVRPLTVQQAEERHDPEAVEEAIDKARTAAKGGKEAFGVWWNTDEGKACRAMVKDIMPELQETVAEADAMRDEDS